jgi:hypothetical protein
MSNITEGFNQIGQEFDAFMTRSMAWVDTLTPEQVAVFVGMAEGEKPALPAWMETEQAALLARMQALTTSVAQSLAVALYVKMTGQDKLAVQFMAAALNKPITP